MPEISMAQGSAETHCQFSGGKPPGYISSLVSCIINVSQSFLDSPNFQELVRGLSYFISALCFVAIVFYGLKVLSNEVRDLKMETLVLIGKLCVILFIMLNAPLLANWGKLLSTTSIYLGGEILQVSGATICPDASNRDVFAQFDCLFDKFLSMSCLRGTDGMSDAEAELYAAEKASAVPAYQTGLATFLGILIVLLGTPISGLVISMLVAVIGLVLGMVSFAVQSILFYVTGVVSVTFLIVVMVLFSPFWLFERYKDYFIKVFKLTIVFGLKPIFFTVYIALWLIVLSSEKSGIDLVKKFTDSQASATQLCKSFKKVAGQAQDFANSASGKKDLTPVAIDEMANQVESALSGLNLGALSRQIQSVSEEEAAFGQTELSPLEQQLIDRIRNSGGARVFVNDKDNPEQPSEAKERAMLNLIKKFPQLFSTRNKITFQSLTDVDERFAKDFATVTDLEARALAAKATFKAILDDPVFKKMLADILVAAFLLFLMARFAESLDSMVSQFVLQVSYLPQDTRSVRTAVQRYTAGVGSTTQKGLTGTSNLIKRQVSKLKQGGPTSASSSGKAKKSSGQVRRK